MKSFTCAALLATSALSSSCSREQTLDKTYQVDKFIQLRENVVGVTKQDEVSTYLRYPARNKLSAGEEMRTSVYFLEDSAVVTAFTPGTQNAIGGQVRKYKDMLGIEKSEFQQAVDFNNKLGNPSLKAH